LRGIEGNWSTFNFRKKNGETVRTRLISSCADEKRIIHVENSPLQSSLWSSKEAIGIKDERKLSNNILLEHLDKLEVFQGKEKICKLNMEERSLQEAVIEINNICRQM